MSIDPSRRSPVAQTIDEAHRHRCDRALLTLTQQKEVWLHVSIPERITYLQQCLDGVNQVAAGWTTAACLAKDIDPASALAGEEGLVGPVATLANLRQLIRSLAAHGQLCPPAVFTRPDGQWVARVFPDNWQDRLLWLGFSGEVWMQPGKPVRQGMVYRHHPERGRVALVLGAGNIAAIAPTDALYKLFAEDQVVLLKMNPVNDYLGKFWEQAFQPLIAAGFLQIVNGDATVGQYLCEHPAIDTIHITGSHQTHDVIVWGRDPSEQQQRKTENMPRLTKPITSELGCVTPILVVPGNWSASDLQFQARQVASMVAHNASFNCVAGKVLVTAKGWSLREAFLQQVRQELAAIPPRQAYYPGATERYQAFLAQYPQAEVVGQASVGSLKTTVPWTVIPDVPPVSGEYALTTEAFCGVLAEVTLDSANAAEFLVDAVAFANHSVWGNLTCMMLVDRATQRQQAAALDQAIAQLQYGAIGINVWTGVIFSLTACPWGAFPGNPLPDIRSGQGFVHNTYLFEYPQKTLLRAPFRIRPLPLWFANHPNLKTIAQHYQDLLSHSDWRKFLRLVFAALRG